MEEKIKRFLELSEIFNAEHNLLNFKTGTVKGLSKQDISTLERVSYLIMGEKAKKVGFYIVDSTTYSEYLEEYNIIKNEVRELNKLN